jgi:uncharacterized DUF497 family protein
MVALTYNAGVEFEWDPGKAESNLTKHGVSFVAAMSVFDDPRRLIELDVRSSRERRFRTVGSVRGELLFVVYTLRGSARRIISARRASRREREAYPISSGD